MLLSGHVRPVAAACSRHFPPLLCVRGGNFWWLHLPLQDCAPAHDFHHSHNTGNFGGFFVFWDWVCGTNESYAKFLAKQKDSPAYQNVLSAVATAKED